MNTLVEVFRILVYNSTTSWTDQDKYVRQGKSINHASIRLKIKMVCRSCQTVYVAEVGIYYMSHDGNLYTRATDSTHAMPRDTSYMGLNPTKATEQQPVTDLYNRQQLKAGAAIPEGNQRPPRGPRNVPGWVGGAEELAGKKQVCEINANPKTLH